MVDCLSRRNTLRTTDVNILDEDSNERFLGPGQRDALNLPDTSLSILSGTVVVFRGMFPLRFAVIRDGIIGGMSHLAFVYGASCAIRGAMSGLSRLLQRREHTHRRWIGSASSQRKGMMKTRPQYASRNGGLAGRGIQVVQILRALHLLGAGQQKSLVLITVWHAPDVGTRPLGRKCCVSEAKIPSFIGRPLDNSPPPAENKRGTTSSPWRRHAGVYHSCRGPRSIEGQCLSIVRVAAIDRRTLEYLGCGRGKGGVSSDRSGAAG